ncbi:MAG: OsmC family protein [Meiothermus sp.]|uniref:OsmC family protein n=1 Tax=Meiothermus sp. TaxID=1955249 RepID=UPI0025FC6938|nr:OsmC family protein [Meiothermus sp.]MCS7057451.1 OsmC family protein [Meiothermus sp.]MCS7194153.1 OsmC family protein [Meiothermus sp.]MCX7740000.1 OsmC family protein [Meiothermus sp.]MDW8091594.1 OsmC family protein [Meiothermus sp.]MDW8481536.1 OsmC family protein [Meiothermus sp.]
MPVRSASAVWKGSLKEGQGHLKLESGVYEGPYTWASRFADAAGTNPEELVGAAHAGCYAMYLSALLTNHNTPPEELSVTARVHLGEGPTITKIELVLTAKVPGIALERFLELAEEAKAKCPISKALAAVPEVTLEAKLV